MRSKQRGAILLAWIMMVGSIGLANTMEVKATSSENTFTLTVPSDTNIEESGWNEIGNVTVTGSIDDSKRVIVEITTDNNSKLKSGDNEIAYSIQKDSKTITGFDFSNTDVNEGVTQSIGVSVPPFPTAPAGNYKDTIRFQASLVNIVTVDQLSSADLGTPTGTFSVSDESGTQTFVAYNNFISHSGYSSWEKAKAFVKALNDEKYAGYQNWCLLGSKEMATAWWENGGVSTQRGEVHSLWSSLECDSDTAYAYACFSAEQGDWDGVWATPFKTYSLEDIGFVVLRGPN